MVVMANVALTESDILRWLQDFMLVHGEQPSQAALRVVEQIESDDLAVAFLRQFGHIAVMEIWHTYTQQGRPHTPFPQANGVVAKGSVNGTANGTVVDDAYIKQTWPERKEKPGAVFRRHQTMLDVLYKVGKEWRPLGSMNKAMLLLLSRQYEGRANSNLAMATWTRRLADSLSGNDATLKSDDWPDAKLMELFRLSAVGTK